MVAAVKLGSFGGSPFRVAIPGIDAGSADFDQTIFDANQRPYRIFSNGYFNAAMGNIVGAGLFLPTQGPFTYSTPSGQFPLFNIMWRYPDGTANDVLRTASACAGLLSATDGHVWGLSYNRHPNGSANTSNYCNYLVFKNFG